MKKDAVNLFQELNNNAVQSIPNELSDDAFIQWGNQIENVEEHINSYFEIFGDNNGGTGPIEKNPNVYEHIEDFDLSRIFLLLGPFPSSQYLQNDNILQYYYGDDPELWYYLFGFEGDDVTVGSIKGELGKRSISITDVYAYAQRKSFINPNPNDNLKNIVLNSAVLKVFDSQSNVKTILTLSGTMKDFVDNNQKTNTTSGLRWIIDQSKENFSISAFENGPFYPLNNDNVNLLIDAVNGPVWWLKKGNNSPIKVVSLPSPSKNAARRMTLSGFFREWVNSKIDNINVLEFTTKQLKAVMAQHQDVFTNTPTKKYRREVYQNALMGE